MSSCCHVILSLDPFVISEQIYTVSEIDRYSYVLSNYGIAVIQDGHIYRATIVRPDHAITHFRRLSSVPIGEESQVKKKPDNTIHEAYIDELLADNLILRKEIQLRREYPCPFHLGCHIDGNCRKKVKIICQHFRIGDRYDICERGSGDPETDLIPDIVLKNSKTGHQCWVEVVDSNPCSKMKLLQSRYPIYEISITVDIRKRIWRDDGKHFIFYSRFSMHDINRELCGYEKYNSERSRRIKLQRAKDNERKGKKS